MRQKPSKITQKKKTKLGVLLYVCILVCVFYVWAFSEWPHACAERWGPVGWCDSYIQIVSNLEALRLQCHGVICTLPARYSAADVFQPKGGEQTHVTHSTGKFPDQQQSDLLHVSNQCLYSFILTCTFCL